MPVLRDCCKECFFIVIISEMGEEMVPYEVFDDAGSVFRVVIKKKEAAVLNLGKRCLVNVTSHIRVSLPVCALKVSYRIVFM